MRALDDPDLKYRVADVVVDYQYSGDHGSAIRLRPAALVDGSVSPYFIREAAEVVSGSHTANMQLIYGAADEPLGLTTNRVQVEMYVENASSFVVRDCDFEKSWRRPDARTLDVRAEDGFDEGGAGQAVVPITVTLAGGASDTHHTPFTLVITQGASVTLQAPALRLVQDQIRVANLWMLPGHATHSTSAVISFDVGEDIEAVVRYAALGERLYLPALMR